VAKVGGRPGGRGQSFRRGQRKQKEPSTERRNRDKRKKVGQTNAKRKTVMDIERRAASKRKSTDGNRRRYVERKETRQQWLEETNTADTEKRSLSDKRP